MSAISFPFDLPVSKARAVYARLPAWAWLAGLAAVLRFVNLGIESPWYDETFTAAISKLSLANAWVAIQGDVHPPLWYAIEWVNTRLLGWSAAALRFPAALFSIAAVITLYHLVKAIGLKERTAIIAGLLAAILPGLLYYGQEARMYSLLEFLIILAMWAALKNRWALFTLALAGVALSQNLAIIYVGTLGLAVFVYRLREKQSILPVIMAGVIVGFLWGLWLPVELSQMQQMGSGFWIQPLYLGDLATPIAVLSVTLRADRNVFILLAIGAWGATILSVFISRRWLVSARGTLFLAVLIGAPALLAVASVLWRSVWLYRVMIPSAAIMCICWAFMLSEVSAPNRRAATIALSAIIAVSLAFYYFPTNPNRTDWRSFFGQITTRWQPGDSIYYTSIDAAVLGNYYLPGKPYGLFPQTGDLNQGLTDRTMAAMGLQLKPFPTCGQAKRVWLLYGINSRSSLAEINTLQSIVSSHAASIAYDFSPEDQSSVNIARIYQIDPCSQAF